MGSKDGRREEAGRRKGKASLAPPRPGPAPPPQTGIGHPHSASQTWHIQRPNQEKTKKKRNQSQQKDRPVKPYMEALGEEGRIVLPHRSAPHPLSPHGPLRGPGPAGPTGSHRGRKSRLTKRPWTEAAGLGSGRAGVGPRIVRLLGGLVLTLCPHAPHCWAGPFMILFGGVCLWPQPPPTPSRHCPPDRAQDPSLSWPPSSPRCLGTPESQPPSVPRRHWGLQAPPCPQ